MIISQRHKFIVFHNPKVGGTSVRATIEKFNDIGFGLWGPGPAENGDIETCYRFFPSEWNDADGNGLPTWHTDPDSKKKYSSENYCVGVDNRP